MVYFICKLRCWKCFHSTYSKMSQKIYSSSYFKKLKKKGKKKKYIFDRGRDIKM